MAKFKLSLKEWRSGRKGKYQTGEGFTLLLNQEGYKCCLGQFCEQLGVDKKHMRVAYPDSLPVDYPVLRKNGLLDAKGLCTKFTKKCAVINDSMDLTVEMKIEMLKKVCEEHGHELEVVE